MCLSCPTQAQQNLRRSAASFLLSRLSSLPRRRLEGAWLRLRLRGLDAASAALRERETEARGRASELQASMERGLQELRVGKEGLEVTSPAESVVAFVFVNPMGGKGREGSSRETGGDWIVKG